MATPAGSCRGAYACATAAASTEHSHVEARLVAPEEGDCEGAEEHQNPPMTATTLRKPQPLEEGPGRCPLSSAVVVPASSAVERRQRRRSNGAAGRSRTNPHRDNRDEEDRPPRVILSVVEAPWHDDLLDEPRKRTHYHPSSKKRGRAASAPSSLRHDRTPPTPTLPAATNQPTTATSSSIYHWLPASLSLEDLHRVASACDKPEAAGSPADNSPHTRSRRCTSSNGSGLASPNRALTRDRSQHPSEEKRDCQRDVDGDGLFDDDDASVASSTAYFEPSDLSPSNWMQAVDAPTFAFGLVALSAAIAHPLLFVAGALAALGTAQAAGAGYDYWNDRPISLVCWRPNLKDAVVGEEGHGYGQGKGSAADGANGTKEARHKKGDAKPSPQPMPPLPPTSPHAAQPLSPHSVAIIPDTPTLEQPNHAQLEQWVAQQYPPLEHPLVHDEAFLGLSAFEVFTVFFDDNAPYNFVEFQKKRGDVDIVYQPWQALSDSPAPLFLLRVASALGGGGSSSDDNASAAELASARLPPPLSYKQRVVTFRAKTHSLLGPPYASTTKTQRFAVFSKRLAILDTQTNLADIPFGDRFTVYERWIVRAEKQLPLPGASTYNARLSASCQIVFDPKQPCPFEGHIRTKTRSTVHEVATSWCSMAQQALRLAHKAKQERLRQEQEHESAATAPFNITDDHTGDKPLDPPTEAIEVEHDGDLGIVTLRRSESEPLHDAPSSARFHNVPQQQHHHQLLSLQGFRRSLSHLTKRGSASSHHPPESAVPAMEPAEHRRPRKSTTIW